jgi:hypothetical protein
MLLLRPSYPPLLPLVVVIMKVGELWGMNYLEGWAPGAYHTGSLFAKKIGGGGEPETTEDRDWFNAGEMRSISGTCI